MKRRLFKTSLPLLTIIMGLVLSAAIMVSKPPTSDANGNQLIVLTANWCANCRSVIPIVQSTAQQRHLSVTLIDVDQQAAPKQAKRFGIPILSRSLPQVFLVTSNSTRLILEGENYTYGDEDLIRSDLLEALK